MRFPRKFLLALTLVLCPFAASAQQPQHLFFRVTVGPKFTIPVSGRMLIFLTTGTGAKEVDENPFAPTAVYVAAKDVTGLAAGASIDVDTDDLAFPAGFSSLKPGDYQAQAVLDVNRNYNYGGRTAGDLISDVVPLAAFTPGQGTEPAFTLNDVVPERPARPDPAGFEKSAHLEDFVSPTLTAFSGRPIHIRAWVITPPDYDAHPKESLSHRLLHAWLRRPISVREDLWRINARSDDEAQTTAHDLGHARRILPDRNT